MRIPQNINENSLSCGSQSIERNVKTKKHRCSVDYKVTNCDCKVQKSKFYIICVKCIMFRSKEILYRVHHTCRLVKFLNIFAKCTCITEANLK